MPLSFVVIVIVILFSGYIYAMIANKKSFNTLLFVLTKCIHTTFIVCAISYIFIGTIPTRILEIKIVKIATHRLWMDWHYILNCSQFIEILILWKFRRQQWDLIPHTRIVDAIYEPGSFFQGLYGYIITFGGCRYINCRIRTRYSTKGYPF